MIPSATTGVRRPPPEASKVAHLASQPRAAAAAPLPAQAARARERPRVDGKFLWRGDEKLYLRGVTYGTFAPNPNGELFPAPDVVERDFEAMAANGINTVRTYTPPPLWLLDVAQQHGLSVLCGLPWEQHIAFHDDVVRRNRIAANVRRDVRALSGHPAILGFAVGNEIPGDIVRWYGRHRIERFLARLAAAVRAEDPRALVTYVNFPTTEYLDLPFVDFVCFNVYLEHRDRLEAYLARLQNLAGEKPLVMAEIGLDSQRNGLGTQARTLAWQVQTVFAAGCAGAYVFAWTDEWNRGDSAIDDWDFGLVDRQRLPKPALSAVAQAYATVPFPERAWPRVTVAICSYNGARTIAGTLDGATALDYPDYEVIVVDDGSTDGTAEIAGRYAVRLISTEARGLSSARNTAWQAATGEIVAYTDDDARPDAHWLQYLVEVIERHELGGAGGPNIPPRGDGLVAACVANAPGGPAHVLLDDTTAEHIPGCNMAFRREVLVQIGGFDPRYRAAGDDVDLCWRVQEAGHRIGFSPAAMVWHHRRNGLKAYWKQQQGYGKAEALLEAKWPERYDELGHLPWRGRIYGPGQVARLHLRGASVYHGSWGSAPFQSLYGPGWGPLAIATTPEWYLLAVGLAFLAILTPLWPSLLFALPLLGIVLAIPITQALLGAKRAVLIEPAERRRETAVRFVLTAYLHTIQPIARLKGRLDHGLTPWRRRGAGSAGPSLRVAPRRLEVWSEQWRSREDWLTAIAEDLRASQAIVRSGGDYDPWDLDIRGGSLGGVRITSMVEEHGQGKQMFRLAIRPRVTAYAAAPTALALLATLAAADGAGAASAILATVAAVGAWWIIRDVMHAASLARGVVEQPTQIGEVFREER